MAQVSLAAEAVASNAVEVEGSVRDISDALAWHYFSHTGISRANTTIRTGPHP